MAQTLDDKNHFCSCALATQKSVFTHRREGFPIWFVIRYFCSVSQIREKDKGGGSECFT